MQGAKPAQSLNGSDEAFFWPPLSSGSDRSEVDELDGARKVLLPSLALPEISAQVEESNGLQSEWKENTLKARDEVDADAWVDTDVEGSDKDQNI